MQAIEELEDMLIEATGGVLPPDWRIAGETPEMAFCRVILNPLGEMSMFVSDELRDE